ncbi:MAG TPA: DUF3606 domain-containing protein [bacterium]|nr:DUF3606 domain-containing protein [bacterium]
MSDDKKKVRPQDASRISLTEPYEVNWWCERFGCSLAKLKAAVAAVGDSVKAVEKYLKEHP